MAKQRATRIDVDLSTARSTPERFELNGARHVALSYMPRGGSVQVSIDSASGPFFTVDRPGRILSCDVPLEALYVINDAQIGTAEFQISAEGVEFDFRGSAAAAPDVALAFFGSGADGSTAVPPNLVNGSTSQLAFTNVSWVNDDVAGLLVARVNAIASVSGALVASTFDTANVFYLPLQSFLRGHASQDTPAFFIEDDLLADGLSSVTGMARCMFGLVGDANKLTVTGSPQYPIGVGFLASSENGGAFSNWRLVIIEIGTPGDEWPATVLVDIDTGIAAGELHRLRVELGVSGGEPYVRGIIDGVVVAEHRGALADFRTSGEWFSPGHIATRYLGNSVDYARIDAFALGRFRYGVKGEA